jgi:mannose-6-phosphate isomerase-like protein (cupin superfamily)
MANAIPVQSILPAADKTAPSRQELLPGEIAGASTFALAVPPGKAAALPAPRDELIILCLLAGDGRVDAAGHTNPFDGRAVYIAPYRAAVTVAAGRTAVSVLEIRWRMQAEDAADLERAPLPYFTSYAACKTYREAIKSPKTINRTLVPENTVPRFCMGSVETEGPDAVGAHAHPMLEQHFFGLPGNDVQVKADEAETRLTENMLLHIPLGSSHSVRVDAGRKLHYIWIDYFRDRRGVEWITRMHKTDP